jgi:hypothetical protein
MFFPPGSDVPVAASAKGVPEPRVRDSPAAAFRAASNSVFVPGAGARMKWVWPVVAVEARPIRSGRGGPPAGGVPEGAS